MTEVHRLQAGTRLVATSSSKSSLGSYSNTKLQVPGLMEAPQRLHSLVDFFIFLTRDSPTGGEAKDAVSDAETPQGFMHSLGDRSLRVL